MIGRRHHYAFQCLIQKLPSVFRCHHLTGFRNIRRFHYFPADQNYRILLPSTNAFDVESPHKLSSILHLPRDYRKLYFTNSGVVCLSRPRVPASHVPVLLLVTACHSPEKVCLTYSDPDLYQLYISKNTVVTYGMRATISSFVGVHLCDEKKDA